MIWRYQVQLNTEVYLSFASIYINPDYMKHLIKCGLGSSKCCAWVGACVWFNLVCLCRVAKTILRKHTKIRILEYLGVYMGDVVSKSEKNSIDGMQKKKVENPWFCQSVNNKLHFQFYQNIGEILDWTSTIVKIESQYDG